VCEHYDLIVHHNDLDGHVAAWVLWMSRTKYTPMLRAVDYGDAAPDVYRQRTAVVDFCFDRETMDAMAERAPQFLVLDHHQSTLDKYPEGLPDWLHVDRNHAACRMAWDYLYPGKDPPPIVKFVEDQDLWRFQLPGTREYCAALETYREFGGWPMHVLEAQYRRPFEELIAEGRPIVAMMDRQIDTAVARSRRVLLSVPAKDGGVGTHMEAVVTNSTVHPSEVADALLSQDGVPDLAIVWWNNGRGYHYSLRSKTREDVCDIATLLGGGGHKRAAGIQREIPLHWSLLDD